MLTSTFLTRATRRYAITPAIALTVMSISSAVALADPWNADNDPAMIEKLLDTKFEYQLSELPTSAMLPNEKMPWSDDYWASNKGGISYRWADPQAQKDARGDAASRKKLFEYKLYTKEELLTMSSQQLFQLSPAEKYDIYLGRYDYPTVMSERSRTNPTRPAWEGLCHGWIQAAIHHPEPKPITVNNPDGIPVVFATSDVNALMTYYYATPTYDYARGMRWASHYRNLIQYLDSIDPMDGSKWVDITEEEPALVDGYVYGRARMETYLNDTENCLKDEYLRGGYIERTYIPSKADLKKSYDECKKRDDKCRTSVVEYAMTNMKVDAQNQCTYNSQKKIYFPHLNTVAQVGLRVESRGLVGNIFNGRKGIQDVNPGAFHVLLTNMIGMRQEAFGANIASQLRSLEVWNQPVVGFSFRFLRAGGADTADSEFEGRRGNRNTRHVEVTVHYVKEIYPHMNPVVGTSSQKIAQDKFRYKLQLDNQGRIIGGDWAKRASHPNFVWVQKPMQFRGYFTKLSEIYDPRWKPAFNANATPALPAEVEAAFAASPAATPAEPVVLEETPAAVSSELQ